MELDNIVQVTATSSETEVNRLIEHGWVLLSSGFHRGEVPGYDYHSYSLGLPRDVAASSEAKNDDSGLDF